MSQTPEFRYIYLDESSEEQVLAEAKHVVPAVAINKVRARVPADWRPAQFEMEAMADGDTLQLGGSHRIERGPRYMFGGGF